ncbi:MAG: M3 family oligoendopeptidase [Bacilli bacterium]|nr:M3 family oligoendopeptidase [Bacilli bacterium]
MKFRDYIYKRPNLEEIGKEFEHTIEVLKTALSDAEQIEAIHRINQVRRTYDTMASLCYVRSAIDTTDAYYEREQDYFDENDPLYSSYEHRLGIELLNSKFRSELDKHFGHQLFALLEAKQKTFKPEIIDDLKEENRLVTEYRKLTASAKIEFNGKINNLSQMGPYLIDTNRQVRRDAEKAIADFFKINENKFDDIYDRLVKVRDKIGRKLGFANFIEVGYARLGRTDYTKYEVESYRMQVERDLVPLSEEIITAKMKRLGIDDPKSYDLGIDFKSGNPTPYGCPSELVNSAQKMYHELSSETGEFIDFMINRELLDLEAKAGKSGGGFCTYFFDYKSPFIFSNFNGTSGDVDVLTHEAGHAFQVYTSRNSQVLEYLWPTYEACEVHSMSMEFFAWPWMELFFKDDADRYRYQHLAGTVTFIPYGVLIDEYQHRVYEEPNLSPDERKKVFRELEKKYMPYKVYENEFFDKGTFWFRQSHVFATPFYYIDYTLAQVCAHQFWLLDRKNHQDAWSRYYHLCSLGGSMSFIALCNAIGLKNPFVAGTVQAITAAIKSHLDGFDPSKLV